MSKTTMIRGWAESVVSAPVGSREEAEVLAAEHILATTNPPTMDKVAWDVEKHVLAGARLHTDNDEQVDVVMLGKDVSMIEYATLDGKPGFEHCSYLTPNGKRYELREVTDKPSNPETLTTVEDYRTAPVGTIAVDLNGYPWLKINSAIWVSRRLEFSPQTMSMHGPHSVLRPGWGE